MLQMLIGAWSMGNYSIGPYEGEEDGKDRQEFMLNFVLADTDPVKQAVIHGMTTRFRSRMDINELQSCWWQDCVLGMASLTDETGFENGFFAVCGISRRAKESI